jgi:hypothetical protein
MTTGLRPLPPGAVRDLSAVPLGPTWSGARGRADHRTRSEQAHQGRPEGPATVVLRAGRHRQRGGWNGDGPRCEGRTRASSAGSAVEVGSGAGGVVAREPQCSARGAASGAVGAGDVGSPEHLSPAHGASGTVGVSWSGAASAPVRESRSRWAACRPGAFERCTQPARAVDAESRSQAVRASKTPTAARFDAGCGQDSLIGPERSDARGAGKDHEDWRAPPIHQ